MVTLIDFLLRLFKVGLVLQLMGGGGTNDYQLVAATIPENRLRAEERYPR